MIDWIKSAELNNCTVEWLKDWTDKHPKSNKKVWRICEDGGCDDEREIYFYAVTHLCNKCASRTPEAREAARLKTITQFATQVARDDHSALRNQYNRNHPELSGKISKTLLQYHVDNPGAGIAHSDRLKDSEASKIAIENQRGGNDIIQHHWLYDDADLSKYTMPMTRKEHGKMHRRMQLDGYKVSHINSETDDNGLWGYK